jgi:pimeloyl-ACP methyl ester carboxylesterase
MLDYPTLTTKSATVKSIAETLNSTIMDLKLDHPQIVGTSLGGAVALRLAHDYPHSNSGITLISPIAPTPDIITGMRSNHLEYANQDKLINELFEDNLYNYSKSTLNYRKNEMLYPNRSLRISNDQDKLEMQAINVWIKNPDHLDAIGHIATHANLVIASKDSLLNSQSQINAFKNYNNKTMLIVNSGHAAYYDEPLAICKMVNK